MSASLSTRAQMPTMPHHQLREHYLEAPNESHTAVHNPGTTIADMRAGACAHNRGSTTSAASSLRVQVLMPPLPQLRFHCLHTCKRLVTTRPARITKPPNAAGLQFRLRDTRCVNRASAGANDAAPSAPRSLPALHRRSTHRSQTRPAAPIHELPS